VIGSLVSLIDLLTRLAIILVIAYVFMSYFLDPYHPFRKTLSRFVEPLLVPIRRLIPPFGMFDLSPLILIILLQIFSQVFTRLLVTLF